MDSAIIDLVVLAGGAATRLGTLCRDTPKPLLPVAGVPFLAYPLNQVARTVKLGRVVICARKGNAAHFRQVQNILPQNIHIIEENEPVGTGGAILSALTSANLSDPFLVMNGDVLFRMEAAALVDAARTCGAAITAIHVPDAGRFGALTLEKKKVSGFEEKNAKHQPGLISAGLYAFTHESLREFRVPCSFEHDIAPVLARRGILSAVTVTGPFMDIGTPQSYEGADAFVRASAQNH